MTNKCTGLYCPKHPWMMLYWDAINCEYECFECESEKQGWRRPKLKLPESGIIVAQSATPITSSGPNQDAKPQES